MAETLRALKKYPIILAFFGFLAVFCVADLLAPDHAVSELENRPLAAAPPFMVSAFLNNEWTKAYGEYTKDQFLFRDGWISLQSALELAQGKLENGGVWFAQDGYLIAKNSLFTESQRRTLATNTEAVAELAARHPGQVDVMVVPSPANILSGTLRWRPPQVDEDALLDATFAQLAAAGATVVDVREDFRAHLDRQLYYRTDHHWTTDGGAQLAYLAYCEAAGMEPQLPAAALRTEVPGFLGTNYAKSKRLGAKPDTLVYYNLPNTLTIYGNDAGEVVETTGVMQPEKLASYDMYGAFLHGNNGYSVIEGTGEGRVLVIKDSYGNAFVPYLAANYEQVGIIDLRAWREVDAVFAEGGYDSILVLYSFDNFTTDQNAYRMMDEAQS